LTAPAHSRAQSTPAEPKPAPQDYLKAIHRLTEAEPAQPRRAGTKEIAAQLGVSAPSVSAMLDHLAGDGLIDYQHYRGARLSPRGRAAALRVIRRHRLLELYLSSVLGLGWEEVHEEAERLEHVLSDRLEAAMDRALGHPTADPHGDPIPGRDGSLPRPQHQSLWTAVSGREARVSRVSDADPDLLRHLQGMGVVPGASVAVMGRESGGALRLRVKGRQRLIGREAAERVFVTPQGEENR
jgi:DtxR family Mn-dependent transcriptional regulator